MALPSINIPNFAGASTAVPVANSGRQAAADSSATVQSNEDFAAIGALTETAPASDTASSGLNGRLQRIAQRLSSLIALLPASLGTKTAANSLPVTLASDGSIVLSAGTPSDAAWTSGNGTLVGLLKAIAANAISTSPSPVEIGPFGVKQVAASQTTAVLGATGVAGDYFYGFHIQPATTSPGAVTVYDGTSTVIYSFPGGASSVASLVPFSVALCAPCANAGWHVTTGANVSVTAIGKFT